MHTEDEEHVSDLKPFLWDGSYQKRWYEVTTASGEKVKCWPNAGIMNSTDGSGRDWHPEDKVLVRRISDLEAMPWQAREARKRLPGSALIAALSATALAAMATIDEAARAHRYPMTKSTKRRLGLPVTADPAKKAQRKRRQKAQRKNRR